MFRKFSLILVTLLIVVPLGVNALGLGEIKLKSGLNQPLRAEISLFSPEGMSEFEVSASLASLNEFEKAGIDYFGYLKNIRFKTVKGPGDSLFVEVSTREPIKEPFLNFLVELNWPKGRMLREYTLLLDPPIFSESRSTTVQTPQANVGTPKASTQTRRPQTRSAPTRSTPSRKPTITGTSYGPVGEAETLWRIATGVKPANASIHQTLVALYRANPNAFVNGNIHLLKKGSTLVIPDAETITSTPKRAALQDMVARLRGDRETVLDTTGRSSSNNRATRGEDRLRLATPGKGTGSDRSGSGGANEADVRRLKGELAETKEAAATLEAENEELRRKLQDALVDLEEQKKGKVSVDSEVGAAIANQDSLSDQQTNNQATNDSETITDTSVDSTSDSTVDTSSVNDQASTTDSTATDSSKSQGEAKEIRRLSDSAVGNSNNVNSTGGLKSPPQQTSWMDDPLYLYGALVLVAILVIAFVVFWRMRQRMSDDEFQDDLVVSAQGSSFDSDDSFDLSDSGDDLLDDLGDEDVFNEEGSTEADPLGEADIYIAYGKYDQAEQLLSDAIADQPERKDLKLKLLECYAESKDRSKFDAAEQEYSDSFFGDAAATAQLQDIKNNAWPEDAGEDDDFELPSTEEIFGDDESSASADSIDDFSLDDLDSEGGMSLDDDFSSDDVLGEEADFDTEGMDFDIEEPTTSGSADSGLDDMSFEDSLDDTSLDNSSLDDDSFESSSLDDSSLDGASLDDSADEFSLDDDLLDHSDSGTSGLSSSDDDLDLDLDADSDAEISLDDDLDMNLDDDFDLGDDDDLDSDMMDGTDEASTKLDLARAYIDMGDIDGAKEILNEVIEEGGESHKSEALALLEKI